MLLHFPGTTTPSCVSDVISVTVSWKSKLSDLFIVGQQNQTWARITENYFMSQINMN